MSAEHNARPLTGPLSGVTLLEVGGIGPLPYCGMMFADLGADVIRVERRDQPAADDDAQFDLVSRGKRSIGLDLRNPDAIDVLLRLVEQADVLLESNRPGVAERLGVGPSACLERNPRLIYGQMTGWGQVGPLVQLAGHDINYLALSGALYPIGPADGPPVAPLHHLGNYGGGAIMLAFGVLAALTHARATGTGQVVDASMLDGVALMTTYLHGELAAGRWHEQRGTNLLDGGAPFYRTYECSDGGFVAVGAIERKFSAQLLDVLGLAADDPARADWYDPSFWPALSHRVEEIFLTQTRDDWIARAAGFDACLAPVLTPTEAPAHPHNQSHGTFVQLGGFVQPAPAPRFSATPGAAGLPVTPRAHTDEVLAELGYSPVDVARLHSVGAVG
jgi:alpha-methylacyl-CoA racemase